MKAVPRRILPVIVVAQLAGTSLWFAGNAAMPDLQRRVGLPAEALGSMTTAVQLGFIAGTLVFAFFALADRYSPRRVFLASALLGAAFNATTYFAGAHLGPLLLLRFLTGFFLAGIYPVGMKIASGWFDRDLGQALGFLVGALVLGTAMPHLIGHKLPWEGVMLSVSAIATFGGLLMYWLVPDGPYLRAGASLRSNRVCRHLSLAGFPRLIVRLLRSYVGALCSVDFRAGLSCCAGRRRNGQRLQAYPCGALSSLAREPSAASPAACCRGVTAAPRLRSFSSERRVFVACCRRLPSGCRRQPCQASSSFGASSSLATPRNSPRSMRATRPIISSAPP